MEEKVLFNATVCFLVKEDKILLGLKTKKIGKGSWNGYGGGIEDDESPEDAAVRELREETAGVVATPDDLEKIAIVDFHNTKTDGSVFVCKVHFYLVKNWEGEIKETEEMVNPTWFDKNNLPLDKMMPADKEWLPIALSGQKIIATAYLSPFQQESLKGVEMQYVDSFHD